MWDLHKDGFRFDRSITVNSLNLTGKLISTRQKPWFPLTLVTASMAFLGWSHRSGTSKVPLHSQQDAAARCGFFFLSSMLFVL